jgi:hypothetical protein
VPGYTKEKAVELVHGTDRAFSSIIGVLSQPGGTPETVANAGQSYINMMADLFLGSYVGNPGAADINAERYRDSFGMYADVQKVAKTLADIGGNPFLGPAERTETILKLHRGLQGLVSDSYAIKVAAPNESQMLQRGGITLEQIRAGYIQQLARTPQQEEAEADETEAS